MMFLWGRAMQNCLYKGRRINAISVLDNSYEYRKEIRLASTNKELFCEECNSPMILRVCTQKVSHFAHARNYNVYCKYNEYSASETEEHRLCKKVLYNYFKGLYPDATVETEFRVVPDRRTDVYLQYAGCKLAIDINNPTTNFAQWNHKHEDYKKSGLTDLWIVEGKPFGYKEKLMPFLQQAAINESLDCIALFLDARTETITLMKKLAFIHPYSGAVHTDLFRKEYLLSEIIIQPDGRINCQDFTDYYSEAEELFKSQWVVKEESSESNCNPENNGQESEFNFYNYLSTLPYANETVEVEQINTNLNSKIEDNNQEEKHTQDPEFNFDKFILTLQNEDKPVKFEQLNTNLKSNNNSIYRSNHSDSSTIEYKSNNKRYYQNNRSNYSYDKAQFKGKMEAYINKAIAGNEDYIKYLIRLIHDRPDNYYSFLDIKKAKEQSKDIKGIEVCEKVLKQAGF